MKHPFLKVLLALACLVPLSASAQKLNFSYDASGNQTERRWVCINCRPAQSLSSVTKMSIGTLSADQQGTEIVEKKLNIYPNPVRESVNISWQLPNRTYVKTMDVLSMGGNRVFSGKFKADQNSAQIALDKLPPGTYLLVIRYSDEQTESIKLIKI